MTYCTQQNLIDRFGELELIQRTDRANLGVIDTAVLTQAIANATAEIDSYLTAYPLPLTTIPANLVRIACDIARYYLFSEAMTDVIRSRYTDAIKYLVLVSKGQVSIAPDSGGVIEETLGGDVDFIENSIVSIADGY